MTYSVIELAEDVPAQLEQLGTKTKFWYRDKNGLRMMFKEGRPGTGCEFNRSTQHFYLTIKRRSVEDETTNAYLLQ